MERGNIDINTHPKLAQHKAIKKLTEAFGESLQKGFLYGSLKENGTLEFYFKHPLFIQEFKLQKETILEKMRNVYKSERLQGSIFFKRVEAVLKMDNINQAADPTCTRCPYEERAKGFFKNECQGKTGAIFEELRKIVKERAQ